MSESLIAILFGEKRETEQKMSLHRIKSAMFCQDRGDDVTIFYFTGGQKWFPVSKHPLSENLPVSISGRTVPSCSPLCVILQSEKMDGKCWSHFFLIAPFTQWVGGGGRGVLLFSSEFRIWRFQNYGWIWKMLCLLSNWFKSLGQSFKDTVCNFYKKTLVVRICWNIASL